MAQVTLKINGRAYVIACDDGQEQHLTQVAGDLDRRVRDLAAGVGQIGEARLLVMTSLLMVDELLEKNQQLEEVKSQQIEAAAKEDRAGNQAEALALLDHLASRLDTLVEKAEDA